MAHLRRSPPWHRIPSGAGDWLGGGARDVIAVLSSESLRDRYFGCPSLSKMVKFDLGNCARLMCVFLEAEYSNRVEWVELD